MSTWRSSVSLVPLSLAFGAMLTSTAFADGELDLGFSPPAELGSNFISAFSVIGGQAYVSGQGLPVSRLHEDGSLDAAWQLASPSLWANAIRALPWGGVAVAGNSGLFVQYADGTVLKPVGGGLMFPFTDSLLPQEDGSVTVISGLSARKLRTDGTFDPEFRIKVPLQSPQTSRFLGAVNDSMGRYVVVGDFRTSVPPDRSGVIRLLADGSLDQNWNPIPDLTTNLNGNGALVGLTVAALAEDSVLLMLPKELVWIDREGKVAKRLPNPAGNGSFASPLIQPDGKIIVGGNFFKGGDLPASGLIRLNPDGTVDPSFNVELDRSSVLAMDLDGQGRLWIYGLFRAVNGVARPGIARLQAYTPAPTNTVALQASITAAPRHVATNEALYLTAQVDGLPEPSLQWLRDGTPIVGATNRGLRLAITNGNELGAFSLMLSNDSGALTLPFPAVSLAARSPHPGTEDRAFNRALTNFIYPTHLVPLPDGRILVGSGNPFNNDTAETPLVGRLLPDGGLDSSFGHGGVVVGQGHVETLVPLAGGGLLVTGDFTELGGQPAQGLAELDRAGNLVVRPFPSLDIVHVSTALPLPDGKLMIAGPFTQVNNAPAFRLARLNPDLTLDTAFHSPVVAPRFVDAMALDLHGRVLIAGERTYGTDQVLTNPPSLGLMRLLTDGSPDPAFQVRTNSVRTIFVEEDGKLLVGMPAVRMDEDGNVLTVFDDSYPYAVFGHRVGQSSGPNHLMGRTPSGGVIYQSWQTTFLSDPIELWRWKANGERDYAFQAAIPREPAGSPSITTMAALPDDSILVSVFLYGTVDAPPTPEQAHRLRRIAPDSDWSLWTKDVSAGQFHVSLATQPGLTYEIYQRDQLTGGTPTKIGDYSGDGYVLDLEAPATGDSGFLELRRH